ncbi:MAG: phosphoribosylformylglycinamidine synthase subunit PurL [Pseudomonadota bacterium]|nr:phosphoribosylformylglycinamidine synthase subunit PurL [Pseudomonadota bacterium]
MTDETLIKNDIIAEHGLTPDEYYKVTEILGRNPNLVELGIFSVMWSEHCSYKSSRHWLKRLPTEAPWVIQGPGENAGVIDIGDGQAAIFKMESHNHPSFIEPYQGAATGVGGILRDVFTMGARPIANMNALRFGHPDDERTRHLVSGVVSGIGGYGNCVGVPTVGGECNFHHAYDGNILVNAMTVGVADGDKIFYSAAAGIGNSVVYVGSKTGRDGIHGATMASAEFTDNAEEKRPTVQVGDPFTEKLLIEACLELMLTDSIVAIQDMGAAGLTSSSVEMASKGQVGIELDMDLVPVRERGMSPYEIMLSESQERMLMVIKPGSEITAREIFQKWGLDFEIIGLVTDTNHLVLKSGTQTVCDIPVPPLVSEAPIYERSWVQPPPPAPLPTSTLADKIPIEDTLLKMMSTPNLCSRRWIWEQYDHMVMADTIQRPGGDAAVVRVHGTEKALAITTDCTPRYCAADPFEGGRQTVAEAWRNLISVGARPLAVTDNLNFGNPERPEVMGQFVGCIEGMAEACEYLDFPVVSGNVSLYNETNGSAILPTPAIGGVGLIENVENMASIVLPSDNHLFVVGRTEGHIGASIWLNEIEGIEAGNPPPVVLEIERKNGEFIHQCIKDDVITACHDISDGGLLVALAEMALAGRCGADITVEPDGIPLSHYCFGEDQGRYLVATRDKIIITEMAKKCGIELTYLGKSGGNTLTVNKRASISLSSLRDAHESWFPEYMAG